MVTYTTSEAAMHAVTYPPPTRAANAPSTINKISALPVTRRVSNGTGASAETMTGSAAPTRATGASR